MMMDIYITDTVKYMQGGENIPRSLSCFPEKYPFIPDDWMFLATIDIPVTSQGILDIQKNAIKTIETQQDKIRATANVAISHLDNEKANILSIEHHPEVAA